MSTIKIQNLSFRYFNMNNNLFSSLNLNIDSNWKLGLIGRNGRGKTTFLKILLNKLTYSGTLQSDVRFTYFPQNIVNPQQSVKKVLLEVANIDIYNFWKIQIEMEKLKLKDNILNQPFKTLSPGEQTKALLAAMFIDKNHFQLIDEPTNHLDILGRDIVSNYLKSKHGFIIVSHDKSFVNAIINHVLSIERTKIQLYKGNYTTWEHEFTQNNNSEAKRNKEIKDEIKQLNISAEKTKKWSNNSENKKFKKNYSEKNAHLDKGFLSHKASKLMQRRKNTLNHLNNDINEKSKLLKNIDKIIPLKLNYTQPYQKHLLTVKDLSVYNGSNVLNKSINFDLTRGMRLVIEGPNGVGKTTIIKSILSQDDIVYTGEINLNKKIKIAYLSQNLYGLEGYISDYAQKNNIEISNLLNTLRKLGFERSVFKQKLENLSMGQKRKVKLAKSLCQNANLYVWDEPLNYLDAITRDQIKNLILKYKPTMIIVEHDKDFINSIATQKIMLKKH